MSEKSGELIFRPRARIIKTIGEELISNDEVAIIELVKNSYDAGSPEVKIIFEGNVVIRKEKVGKKEREIKFIEKGSSSLFIEDQGKGMSFDIIKSAWMEPATNFKKKEENKDSNRRFTGEKGIGRFASAKLASKLELVTLKENSTDEFVVNFDWDEFSDENKYLDKISVKWRKDIPTQLKNKGTILKLLELNSEWDEDKIRNLRVTLSRLLNPVSPISDFKIHIVLPKEFKDLSGEVFPPNTIDKPDYLIKGQVNESGVPELIYFSKLKNCYEKLSSGDVSDQYLKTVFNNNFLVGAFSFEFRVWNREASSLKLLAQEVDKAVKSVKTDLDELSGISIYRDNFRVLPYGNQNNDWLRLDKRRVNNPTMRLSNNQIIGYISIGIESNPDLKDQSNREGIVDNKAFEELKEYVKSILNELELRRYLERPREKDSFKDKNLLQKFSLDDIVDYINLNIPNNASILEIVKQKKEDVKEGLQTLQNTISRYRRLSTLGMMVDIISHDGGNFLNKIDLYSKRIDKELSKENPNIEIVKKKNNEIIRCREELNLLFKRIAPLGGRQRGQPKLIVLEDVIKDQIALHNTFLRKEGIEVILPDTTTKVKIDESELGIVFMNLIQNSMYWLREVQDRKIQIVVYGEENEVSILFSDSGPGIKEDIFEAIFEPYFSTKKEGIGLGLAIVGEIVSEYDGELSLVDNGPLDGATFKMTFKYRI